MIKIEKACKSVDLQAFDLILNPILLSCQVSNLNSSDPETDVLPITPQDSFMVDPSRLELELFWTKTRRVANYTTGQSRLSY